MNEKEITEALQFGIGRYDHYYDSINNKSNAFLTLNTFLLAGILAAYYSLTFNTAWWYKSSFILILLLNLIVTIFTLIALRPSLSKGFTKSRFWFGDVACLSQSDYLECWKQPSHSEHLQDLSKQMHALACGLRKKFYWLNLANYFLMAQLALIAIMGFINIK